MDYLPGTNHHHTDKHNVPDAGAVRSELRKRVVKEFDVENEETPETPETTPDKVPDKVIGV
jgi:hypothetical protein